jgi:hypothetical protein
LQNNDTSLTPDSITTAFSQAKLSAQNTPNNLNESSLDERLEKKRKERELYVIYNYWLFFHSG